MTVFLCYEATWDYCRVLLVASTKEIAEKWLPEDNQGCSYWITEYELDREYELDEII